MHAQNFFESGANLAGILTVESSLTDKMIKAIQDAWHKAFRRRSDGSGSGIAVLQGNMKYQPLTVNPTDAQLLETRKFNVTDIARFFGVSPTKLFDFTHSSYSTVEATQLAFLTDTLSPILQKFELEFERKLFLPVEQPKIDVQFDTSILVRLDVKAQSDYYRNLYNMGAVTPNEIRRDILRSPVEGGNHVFIQGAMTTIENVIASKNYQQK
jgi:HK97 family phage portal protein